VSQVLVFSITAAFNPTLLAAVTLMLALDDPKRLLLGYLLGAGLMSITVGLVIVFVLGGSSRATSTAKHTINPVFDVALGVIVLVVTFVVATGRDRRRRARSARKKAERADSPPPRWQQALSGGSARTTFVVGALLTLPGASYLAGLSTLAKQDLSTAATVLVVIAFNAIMLALLEVPLLGYTFSPQKTSAAVERLTALLRRHGGRIALMVAALVGTALVARGATRLT
jgi:hypothetical protein